MDIKIETTPKTQPISGVSCDVCNCQYHTKGNSCTAGNIHVGPTAASKKTDTACATFEKK